MSLKVKFDNDKPFRYRLLDRLIAYLVKIKAKRETGLLYKKIYGTHAERLREAPKWIIPK